MDLSGKRLVCMELETPNGTRQMWFTDEHPRSDVGMPEGHPTTTQVTVELKDLAGTFTSGEHDLPGM